MAYPQDENRTPERYEDTVDPRNPPNSVTNRDVRGAALKSYLGPVVALFVIVGLALVYWANRGPVYNETTDRTSIGTSGDGSDINAIGERGNDTDTPGGFDPQNRPGSTRDEIDRRGGDSQSLGRVAVGERITLSGVEVVGVDSANRFTVQNGGQRTVVNAPDNRTEITRGMRVDVNGTIESDTQGAVVIRATAVNAR